MTNAVARLTAATVTDGIGVVTGRGSTRNGCMLTAKLEMMATIASSFSVPRQGILETDNRFGVGKTSGCEHGMYAGMQGVITHSARCNLHHGESWTFGVDAGDAEKESVADILEAVNDDGESNAEDDFCADAVHDSASSV